MLRYERKYLVPNEDLDRLRQSFKPFVRPDKFGGKTKDGDFGYTVRSIYLDSDRLDCYFEKIEGLKYRKKLRIRGYDSENEDSIIFLEIKNKLENRIKKNRALFRYKDLPALMVEKDTDKYVMGEAFPKGIEDSKRFFFHLLKRNLKPTVLIVYDREPYHGIIDSGVRITFDKAIKSRIYPKYNQLFTNEQLELIKPGYFILEIKYFTDLMPRWAKNIVQHYKLRHEALSKYTMGVDKQFRPWMSQNPHFYANLNY